MAHAVHDTTRPSLLLGVADWSNHPAWVTFRDTYDPYLWRWCRRYGLDDEATEEVCQQIWVELAGRMRTFQYDPSRTFRGWLRCLCGSRAVDYLRRREPVCPVDPDGPARPDEHDDPEPSGDLVRRFLFEQAEKVQEAVRAKVKPSTWEAFWLVAVCDWTVERTAAHLGMTCVAVYAARERVAARLRDEGRRVAEGWEA